MATNTNSLLPSEYQEFIHLSRYARWLPDEGRRETWSETVSRYFDFFEERLREKNNFNLSKYRNELEEAVLSLEILPSMRAMMTAGKALKRDAISQYNCSFVAIDTLRSFDEIMYILMCGVGVGFSVEDKFVSQLPVVADEFYHSATTIVVEDSRIGWSKSFKELLMLLYSGQIPKWDISKVRVAGSPLKTFGGRASGPQCLVDLFNFCIKIIKAAAGRKLTSLECHDIVCKVADIVIVGGVRRSALISLSDLFDDRMRVAKSGAWWEANPQRALSNNSYVIDGNVEIGTFMKEWLALYDSKSGERGIFSRSAAKKKIESLGGKRTFDSTIGCNPCSEILLRSKQFCNLTTVIVRPYDTVETLKRKARLAAILGTIQATVTDFRYLSKKWRENTEEERLLGVSMNGIMDNDLTNGNLGNDLLIPALEDIKNEVNVTNVKWAEMLGIPPSAATTCVKPEGTTSQLVDAASGIHDRHSPYYIRSVRQDKKDPLSKMMKDMGFPWEDEMLHPEFTDVFSFPIKSPTNAVFRKDRSAIEQLELWLIYARHWAEHKPSITVSVREEEWLKVGSWVYEHIDEMSGVSFLPMSDHNYLQAPYQECTKEEYLDLMEQMPRKVDWSRLSEYEKTDMTIGVQNLACVAGNCDI